MTENKLVGFEYCEETRELKATIEKSFLSLGERLMKIRDGGLFEGQWTTFAEYLGEMKMSESTASKLINIYGKFVIQFGINPQRLLDAGGWGVVAEILPMCKTREDAERWLDKAVFLSREDLRTEQRIARTGIPPEQCEHLDSYQLMVCRHCGFKAINHEAN